MVSYDIRETVCIPLPLLPLAKQSIGGAKYLPAGEGGVGSVDKFKANLQNTWHLRQFFFMVDVFW